MALFNTYADVENNPEFADFVKKNFKIDDVSNRSEAVQNFLFKMFKISKDDFDKDDLLTTFNQIQEDTRSQLGRDISFFIQLKNAYGEKLSPDEQAELNNEIAQLVATKSDEFKTDYSDYEAINQMPSENELDEQNIDNNDAPTLVVDEEVDEDEPENIAEQIVENQEIRLRSLNSDQNDFIWDIARYQAMADLKVIDSPKQLSEAELIDVVKQKMPTAPEEKAKVEEHALALMIEQKFEAMPPSLLAEAYTRFGAKLNDKNVSDEDKQRAQAYVGKVEERIDELTDMLVADTHESHDLFFLDVTNVQDCYDGYNKMFKARAEGLSRAEQDDTKQLTPAEQTQISERRDKLQEGVNSLSLQYDEYLGHYGLSGIEPKNAGELEKNFDNLNKRLQKLQFNDDIANTVVLQNEQGQDVSLAQLLSNFKFEDEQGNIEPQFVDAKGNESDTWTPGAKIIKGSKLETAIALSKQDFLQHNLTNKDKIEDEELKKIYTENLPQTLHVVYSKALIEKGMLEDRQEFTTTKFQEDFLKSLGEIERPMYITPTSANAAFRAMVDGAYGFRDVLAHQLDTKEAKGVVGKICTPIAKYDVRNNARVDNKAIDPNNVWKSYASEVAQGMAAAAIGTARVKGALLVAAGAAHAATGVAVASTMLAASAIIPVALSMKQVYSWRKEQKAAGKPTGFKAFIKDKNMMLTMATTALTEAAVGCAFIPGAQPVAVALGAAALAIGVGRGAKHDYDKLRAAGKGKFKAAGAALVGSVLKVGTAFLVNKGLQAVADNYMQEKYVTKEGQEEKSHMEWREGAELAAKARHTLETFYGKDMDALDHDLKQVEAQLKAMGRTDISPEVFLRNAVDAGMNTGVDTLNHVDGGGVVHTHGNNTVLTEGWSNPRGMNYDLVKALGSIKDADGNIHITADALKGHDAVKFSISTINEVGHTEGTQAHHDGVLNRNASVNSEGRTVHDSKSPDRFNTYADGDHGYVQEKVIDQHATQTEYGMRSAVADTPDAVGMLGIRNGWMKKFTNRVGSFADKILGRRKIVVNPAPDNTKPNQDKKTIETTVVDNQKPNQDEKTIVVQTPVKTPTVEDSKIKLLLNEEYQMLYGYRPTLDDKQYQSYCKRVEEERQALAEPKDMLEFLTERRQQLDDVVEANLPAYLGSDRAQKDLQHLQGYVGHIPQTDKVLKQYKDKRTNSPVTNAIRQNFWQKKNGNAEEWKFGDFISSAKDYMQRNSSDVKSRDNTKAPAQRPGGAKPKVRE